MAWGRFTFRPGLTVTVALALGVLVSLGSWQLHRLDWKRDLIAQVEARIHAAPIAFDEALRMAEAGENMEYTPVSVTGRIDSEKAAFVFGSYGGVPGVFAFAPLTVENGETVYVNEGFIPQDARAEAKLSDGRQNVTGLFRSAEKPAPPAVWFQPKGKSVDGFWFIRDPQAFAAEAGIEATSYYIDQFDVEGRDFPKGGTTRLEFNNRHLEYAFTWYGLAAALVGVWIVFSLKETR